MDDSTPDYSINNEWGWFVDIEAQTYKKTIKYKPYSYKSSLPPIKESSCNKSLSNLTDMYGFDDMGRYVAETSLLRSRRKRLLEDHYKEEDNRLNSIAIELAKAFKITKDEVKIFMEEFGGTLEELYIHLEQKFPYNKFYLPKSLKHLQSRYD
jgi:hypothetical protein